MNLSFYSTEDTLTKIEQLIENNSPGVYFRFGDGDICLARGESELMQSTHPELQRLMIESIKHTGGNVLKALPLHTKEWSTWEEGMFPGNHEGNSRWAEVLLLKYIDIIQQEQLDIYSAVALCHIATQKPERAVQFLKTIGKKVKYFIGNEQIPRDLINTIFNPNVEFISSPSRNSFSRFDEIYQEFESKYEDKEYSVVVTSMGCSGRPLQKKILDNYNNVFLFDFGSLMDALCGWSTRAWIELTNFNKEEFLSHFK